MTDNSKVQITKGEKGGDYILVALPPVPYTAVFLADTISHFQQIEKFATSARDLGGQWLTKSKRWRFPANNEMPVRRLCTDVFGWHCWPELPAPQVLTESTELTLKNTLTDAAKAKGMDWTLLYPGVYTAINLERMYVAVNGKRPEFSTFLDACWALGARYKRKSALFAFHSAQDIAVTKLLMDTFGGKPENGPKPIEPEPVKSISDVVQQAVLCDVLIQPDPKSSNHFQLTQPARSSDKETPEETKRWECFYDLMPTMSGEYLGIKIGLKGAPHLWRYPNICKDAVVQLLTDCFGWRIAEMVAPRRDSLNDVPVPEVPFEMPPVTRFTIELQAPHGAKLDPNIEKAVLKALEGEVSEINDPEQTDILPRGWWVSLKTE